MDNAGTTVAHTSVPHRSVKKPIKKMRKDRVYFRLAGGGNIINCRVDHKTHKVTKTKGCRYMTLDGDDPICYYPYID